MERLKFYLFISICVWFLLTGECTLTQSPTGLQCTNSTVIFNCTREGTSLLWVLRLQSNPSVPSMIVTFFSNDNLNPSTTQTLTFNNQQYIATLLETLPLLNSSLTITATAGMDLIVECQNDQAEVQMLKLNVSQISVPPPRPSGLMYDARQQDNDTVSIDLTWRQPETDDNNTVDDYTVILKSLQDHRELTTGRNAITLSLSYNTNYTIQVNAKNCIGSSMKTFLGPLRFVDCLPPSAANGVIFEPYSNTTEGARIYYSCNGQNRSVTQCRSNGMWNPDPSTVTCHLVMCEQPPSPVNGSIVYVNGTLEHSQAVYQCNNGLFPPGQHITHCVRHDTTSAGKWSPNPMDVMCRLDPFNCSPPDPPKDGYIDVRLSTDNMTLYYGCNEGYLPIDVYQATCVDQDTWSIQPQQLNCTSNTPPGVGQGANFNPVVPAVTVVVVIVVLVIVTTVTIVIVKVKKKGSKDADSSQLGLELQDTNETPTEYCTTKHPGPRGNQSVTVNTLVYAGLDLPSDNKLLASHADSPTSYADISFTATKNLKKMPQRGSADNLLNLDSLLIQLKPEVTSKWELFARVVGLGQEVITDLSNCGPDERMVEMLDYWLRHHPSKPTWREVAQILEELHLYQLADDLLKVYETGELPVPFDMNEVPEGTLPRNEPPPPLPPKIADLDVEPESPPLVCDLPPKPPPHGGLPVHAPPPLPPPYHENGGSILPPRRPPKSHSHGMPRRPPGSGTVFTAVPALPPKPKT